MKQKMAGALKHLKTLKIRITIAEMTRALEPLENEALFKKMFI